MNKLAHISNLISSEDRIQTNYFHQTMINLQIISSNHQTGIKSYKTAKLEHTTRLKGGDRDKQGARDLRGGGLLHELEEVGGGPHRLRYLLCHRRFSSAASAAAAGRRSHGQLAVARRLCECAIAQPNSCYMGQMSSKPSSVK